LPHQGSTDRGSDFQGRISFTVKNKSFFIEEFVDKFAQEFNG
jgi:hypothetical protein